MATTWPSLTADDVISGKGAKGGVVGQGLFNRDLAMLEAGTTCYVNGSTASSSYTTVDSFYLWIPEFVRSGYYIRLYVYMSISLSGTGYFQIQDNGTSNNGTEQSTTSATLEAKESIIAAPDNTWAGTVRLFNVRAKTNGTGTVTIDNDYFALNLRFSD